MKKGFTLIELLLVIGIIGILSTIVIVNTTTAKSKSRDADRISDIRTLQLALELYYNDFGYFPTSLSSLIPNYIPIEPKDPLTTSGQNITAYYYSALRIGGSPDLNCVAANALLVQKYHLGAVMENDSITNASLGQDHDYNPFTYGYQNCSGTSANFHGNANTGGTQPCVGASGANPDKCYDVTN